jgi:chemotaxis protein CheD
MTSPSDLSTGDSIAIGQIGVASGRMTLKTFVGSCVAVVLHSSRHAAAGVAHVMLPASQGREAPPGKYADTAVPETLRLLREATGDPVLECSAKLVGGAKMFGFTKGIPIGDQNVAAVEKVLRELGIEVVGRSCGGQHGRRVTVDVETGIVTVQTAEQGTQTL